jgi:hypothetical protein
MRFFQVSAYDTFVSQEQLGTMLSKSNTRFDYLTERDEELENEMEGYYFTLTFWPPFLRVSVFGNKTLLIQIKAPVRGALGQEMARTYDEVARQISKWEHANFRATFSITFQMISMEHNMALFRIETLHQTTHDGPDYYDHSFTQSLMARPQNIQIRDFFYHLPFKEEGPLEMPALNVNARRQSSGMESSTIMVAYEAQSTISNEGFNKILEIPLNWQLSYKSTTIVIKLLLLDGCTIRAMEPKPQFSSQHQALFTYEGVPPMFSTKIRATFDVEEHANHS